MENVLLKGGKQESGRQIDLCHLNHELTWHSLLSALSQWLPKRQTTRRLAVCSIATLARAGIAW